jgi:hypothetical protein
MDEARRNIEKYRQNLRLLGTFLFNQSHNDLYVLELIKGDELPAFEQALRAFVENA